ncbi:hypothetical protein [Gilvibacter sediminis]|uniref:hypothetical protein n=1 Tax=Gilvibacter sediminis TaxID=379071 RepID=UPI0023509993|nr:hypothetical protein [Gilvibacter sediminis]MDC7996886.1 hypothetical protein [Gilvibacter sediminis]
MLRILLFSLIIVTTYSCEETIFEPDISEDAVSILAPVDGVTIDNETTRFSWNGIDGATEYRIQVATPNFENATQILTDSVVDQFSLEIRLSSGSYQWRVRAQNSGHQTPYTTATFTVE